MKVMTALFGPTDAVERAQVLKDAGASGVFTFEGPFDVFTPLVLASSVQGLDVMSNVVVNSCGSSRSITPTPATWPHA